jgi:hypothetical protein
MGIVFVSLSLGGSLKQSGEPCCGEIFLGCAGKHIRYVPLAGHGICGGW